MKVLSFVPNSFLMFLLVVLMCPMIASGIPKAQIILRVVDNMGHPVANAKVRSGLQTGEGLNDYLKVEGFTDKDGQFTIQGPVKGILHFGVVKSGYYRSVNDIMFFGTNVFHGKWMPYGQTRIVEIKRKRNLGRHVVFPEQKRSAEWKKPCLDKWIGFDFMVYDWVKPFGKGTSSDVLIRFHTFERDRMRDWRHEMEVSFTNNPFGGAYVVKKSPDSRLQWNHVADTNADFRSSFSFFIERHQSPFPTRNLLDGDSCLVFRTRTTTDETGRLKTAHYGVLAGEWFVGKTVMKFGDSCFNPVPNDPDIEDGFYLRRQVESDSFFENIADESSP